VRDRVNFVRPFEDTGVDFTGHFFVQLAGAYVKMYLVIFTCLSVRAVHLELVPDMSTKSFLSAFVRFANRFGLPKSIYSDNAPSFVQAADLLNKSFSDSFFSEYLAKNNVKHNRVPLYSPWVAASWERLLRVVKNCLYKSIGRNKIEYFNFLTIISDVQEAINNRPLTYRDTSDQSQDMVTPNSFIRVGMSSNLTFGALAGDNFNVPARAELIKSLEIREDILDKFRDLWYEEYLLSLRDTRSNQYQPKWEDRIKIGDIVLISAPNKPRPLWIMGCVCKLFTGNDGKTRSAEVQRPDRSTGVYSISLLYPLELSLDSVSPYRPPDVPPTVAGPSSGGGFREPRVRRKAAEQCLQRLRDSADV
jgi:hypothetical protein